MPKGSSKQRQAVTANLREKFERALNPSMEDLRGRGGPGIQQVRVNSGVYVGTDAAGNPMYRVAYTVGGQARTRTWIWKGGRLLQPVKRAPGVEAEGSAASSVSRAPSEAAKLRQAKDRWLAWVSDPNNAISLNDRQSFTRMISGWNSTSARLNARMHLASQNLPFGATATIEGEDDFLFDIPGGGGGGGFGGGGGGGFLGPQYRAPDRRVIEDMAKGMMVSLLGTVDEGLLGPAVDTYMKDHRRNFDSLDQDIDPEMSLLEFIRNTETYRTIHELRPESEDERQWIAQRKEAAGRGGLDTEAQEDFAITQATVGGDLPDVQDAASLAQFQRSGTVQNTLLDNKVRGVIQSMLTGVR